MLSRYKKFVCYAFVCIFIILLAAYISKNYYQLMLIQGASMEPTYHNMQLVVIKKHIDEDDIKNGDVISFYCKKLDAILVKRVVGVPGQRVVIRDGVLFVNGVSSNYYSKETIEFAGILKDEISLSSGEFVVIGDNIPDSRDSRYEEVGVVEIDDIVGVIN